MDYCVANFLNDFCFCSAKAKDGALVDGNTGWQLASGLKKRLFAKRQTLVESQEIVLGLKFKFFEYV